MLLDSPETKEKILKEFLQIAVFDGWNKEALVKAAANCGIGENFLPLIFENGLLDLAEFYLQSQNEKSLEVLENLEGKKIRDKIRLSLYARFEVEKENKIALQRLINFYFDPKNFTSFETGPRPIFQALKACYKIADFIWQNIGDQSTDFNYYTKRATLGKIIFRAIPLFLKNGNINNFIDAEIEKVMRFEKFKSAAKKTLCQTFFDESGSPRSPKELVKNLPFFRLFS
ncbi:MAG: COQ9 family protein [Proteobacteria bacterium]|nr:COQ9 family protein [Pseudomonadota bacterium]